MLTLEQFNHLFPNADSNLFASIIKFTDKYGITSTVMFLSQCSVESGYFMHFSENMNYSAHQLVAVWPSHFTTQTALLYAYQPEKLANYIYANRMGNGGIASGDGWNFRGRGAIQITGKDLYQKFADDTDSNLATVTAYMTTPNGIIESACWYWTHVVQLNKYTNRTDVPTVTKIINGGSIGLQSRYNEFDRINATLA